MTDQQPPEPQPLPPEQQPAQPYQQPQFYPQQIVYQTVIRPPSNLLALWSMILGIVGVLPALTVVGLLLSPVPAVLAIVFGFVGYAKSKTLNGLGRRYAIAGIILGLAPAGILLLLLIISQFTNHTN